MRVLRPEFSLAGGLHRLLRGLVVTACVVLLLSGAAGSRPDVSLLRAPQQMDSLRQHEPAARSHRGTTQFTWQGEHDDPHT
jgi:hypothetical protein